LGPGVVRVPLQRPCTTPGCPQLSTGGRCTTCRGQKRKLDRNRRRDVNDYGPRWPGRRLAFLLDNPTCVMCARLATIPDHYPRSRRQLLADGVTDPDLPQYLRPLCKPCHDHATGLNQPGGWHRERMKNPRR